MIGQGFDSVYLKQFSNLFHLFATQTIYNSRLAYVGPKQANDLIFCFYFGTYLIKEIGSVEGRLEYIGIEHSQILLNITLNLGSGSSGQRNDRSLSYFIDNGSDSAIFRSEVVPPF